MRGRGTKGRGCLLHALQAFTAAGVSLGTVGAEAWARVDQPRGAAKQLALKKQRQQTPLEDKESQRWVEGMHLAHGIAAKVPDTPVVLVSDSECARVCDRNDLPNKHGAS